MTVDGVEYQIKVATYIATCLSENNDVQKYHIYANREIPTFDDVMVKVWYKSKLDAYIYLVQVKHWDSKKIHFNFEKEALECYNIYISKIIDKIKQLEEKNKLIKIINDSINLAENGEIWNRINEKNKLVEEKNNIIEEKNKIIEKKNERTKKEKKEMEIKNNAIRKKNKIIYDSSRSITDRNEAIDEKNQIIDSKDEAYISEFFFNVPNANIEFWFYCNTTLKKNALEVEVDKRKYEIIKLEGKYQSIFSFCQREACYKLEPIELTEGEDFFKRYRLFLNQPNNKEIMERFAILNEVYTRDMTTKLLNYTKEKLKGEYLTKEIFETEILRLSLSKYIISPIESIEVNADLLHTWNQLTLKHDLTIVDEDKIDMKGYVFGCLYQTLDILLQYNIKWNDCLSRIPSKVLTDSKFKELTRKQNDTIPDTLDELLIEMWKCDYLPLALSVDCNISILNKYQHLNKKFVVLDKNNKIINEIGATSLKILANLSDIRDDEALSLRSKLLEGINVSFQGREAVALINLISEDTSLMKKINCSHVLRLMRKTFKLFLEERCLQDTHSMIFIVEDDSNFRGTNFEDIASDDNVIINCKSSEVHDCIAKAKNVSSLKNHSLRHLKRLHSQQKLEIVTEDVSRINHFLIDEYGNDIYFENDKCIPVIGRRIYKKEDEYIPRYLQKAILQKSFFNRKEKCICFFVGDINSLEPSIKGSIINETANDINELIENMLQKNESVYVAIEDERLETYWSKFSSSKYPLFQIGVTNSTMIVLKYKNDHNVSSYISYEGHTFEEDSFFEETTNAITIVTGEPGMGKTTLLHSLFEKYDKSNYVIFCDLVDYRADLENENQMLYDYPLQYILGRFENSTITNSRSLLDVDILNFLCKFHQSTNRLLVLLDSLDEVLPSCKTQVLKFINALVKSNVRIVIASRLIADNLLSNDFEAQPIKIARLDTNATKKYLINKQVTYTDIHKIPVVFLENPLYLKFLVVLFKKKPAVFAYNNICSLYKEIFAQKIDVWLKKMQTSNNNSTYQMEDILREHKWLASSAVFGKKIITDQKLNYDDLKKTCIDTNKVKVGIIVRFSEEYPIFVHQTLAEYLAAEWLAENIREDFAKNLYLEICSSDKVHLKYMFDNILCQNLKLHKAVLNEDLEEVEYICREKNSIQEVDKCGRTVLHLVASALSAQDTDSRRSSTTNLKMLNAIIKRMDEDKSDVYELRDKFTKRTWFQMLNIPSHSSYDELFKELNHLGLTNTIEKYLEYTGKTVKQKNVDFNIIYNFPAAMSLLQANPSKVPYYYYHAVNKAIDLNHLENISELVTLQKQNLEMIGFDDLHINCIRGNISKVQDLILAGADINVVDDFQNIPLHYAVLTNSSEMVSTVMHRTLDINTKGRNGNTPLHFAVTFSKIDIVLSLLSQEKIKINCGNNIRETALHIAARKGRTDIVDLLIKNDADVNLRNAKGETPLHIAVKNDHVEVVEILRESAQTHISDNFSNNALHVAAEIGNKCIVGMLLKSGARSDCKNNLGNTALHIAVMYEKIYVVEKLLAENACIINYQNYRGHTALHEAVENRNVIVVDILLRNGADVNLVNYRNESPLYLAVNRCDEGIIGILLESNADVNYQQFQRAETTFDIALQKGNINIIKLLMKSPTLTEHTMKRCLSSCILYTKRIDILKMIIEKCYVMNPRIRLDTFLQKAFTSEFKDGIKLLREYIAAIPTYSYRTEELHIVENGVHFATVDALLKSTIDTKSCNGRTMSLYNTVKYLLEKYPNVVGDVLSNFRITCLNDMSEILCSAIKEENLSMISLLLDKGADAAYITDSGFSALHEAAGSGNMDLLKELLENGTNIIDMKNKNDASLLYIAIEKGREEVVKLLLEKGATPNFVDHYYHYGYSRDDVWDVFAKQHGYRETGDISALCMAIRKQNIQIVQMLIGKNCDMNVNFNETPLKVAIKHRYKDMVKLLLENGSDVNVGTRKVSRQQISNDENVSAIQMAAQMKSTEMIEILLKHGAHPDTFYHGKTALEMACTNGDAKVVKCLLDKGASVNFKRPLYWAVTQGHEDVISLLLDKIDDATVLNDFDQSLLNIAVKAEKLNIINMLIEKGASVNIQGADGKTPLCNALFLRRHDIVNLLLDKGANINYRYRLGDTALHISTRHHSLDIINTLLKRGANTTLRNKDGATALHTALDVQRFSITLSLIRHDMKEFIRRWQFPLLFLGSLVLYYFFSRCLL